MPICWCRHFDARAIFAVGAIAAGLAISADKRSQPFGLTASESGIDGDLERRPPIAAIPAVATIRAVAAIDTIAPGRTLRALRASRADFARRTGRAGRSIATVTPVTR